MYNYIINLGGSVPMKIAIGSDHAGYVLKAHLLEHLQDNGIDVDDFGGQSPEKIDYPVAGERVADAVATGGYDKGILVCGTGVGMSITANKVPGIRAVVCSEPYSARMSREHNDANILCLGERVLGAGLAVEILDAWLSAQFEGGRHASRVAIITEVEQKHVKSGNL